MGFSDEGKYLAYSRSEAGSDWSIWHHSANRHLDKQAVTLSSIGPEFSNASWTKDNKGFTYR